MEWKNLKRIKTMKTLIIICYEIIFIWSSDF